MKLIKIITVIAIIFTQTLIHAQVDTKLIYVGDPMCSWCYGISEELEKTISHFSDKMETELVLGGLRPYNQETMSDLKSFLTHHWEDVSKASGRNFNYTILEDTVMTYDTEPPSRAVLAVRKMDVTKEIVFFKYIQEGFYIENIDIHKTESYYPYLEKLGLDKKAFSDLFESDELKEEIKNDFIRARDLGASSFPTIMLRHNGELKIIAKGFANCETMISSIESVIK